jgi:hypothetical protein
MAPTTLRGIGDDEEEGSGESSAPKPTTQEIEPEQESGPTVVDAAKVAEALRKLRSLESPTTKTLLGGLTPVIGPSPTKTMLGGLAPMIPGQESPGQPSPGQPSVAAGTINSPPSNPASSPPPPSLDQPIPSDDAAARAGGLDRSIRGTMLGHDVHLPGDTERNAIVAAEDPERPRGTVLGRDLHLPDLPAGVTAPHHSLDAHVPGAGSTGEFGDNTDNFFDTETQEEVFDDERPRPNVIARVTVFVAVVAVFVVAAMAWVRFKRPEKLPTAGVPSSVSPTKPSSEPPPTSTLPSSDPGAGTPSAGAGEGTPAVGSPSPSSAPAPAAEAAPSAPPAAEPTPAAEPPEVVRPKPSVLDRPDRTPPRPARKAGLPRQRIAAPGAAPAGPATAPAPKAAPKARGSRGLKAEDDPDGTLPLSTD